MPFAPVSLTMADAATGLRNGLAAIAAGDLTVDLGRLSRFDSSAVAALLAWQRAAQAKGIRLTLVNVPAGLSSLARLYGVADLLPTA